MSEDVILGRRFDSPLKSLKGGEQKKLADGWLYDHCRSLCGQYLRLQNRHQEMTTMPYLSHERYERLIMALLETASLSSASARAEKIRSVLGEVGSIHQLPMVVLPPQKSSLQTDESKDIESILAEMELAEADDRERKVLS